MRLEVRVCGRSLLAVTLGADDEQGGRGRGDVTTERHDVSEPCTLLGFTTPATRLDVWGDDEGRRRG